MRTGTLVAALTASGIAGGIVGGLLVRGDSGAASPRAGTPVPSPAEPAPRDEALMKEVAALRARLDEMQASVGNAAAESGRLRTELDQEKKASSEARTRLAGLEAGTARAGAPQVSFEPGREFALGRLRGAVVGMDGQGVPERVKRALELRMKPEEERWAAAREALGLSGGQEEDLKAAIKERDQAVKDSVKITGDLPGADGNGNGSATFTVTTADSDKMKEARKAYDDKVSSTLNADQAKKWREDGYEDAFRGGNPLVITSLRNGGPGTGNGEGAK